MCSAFHFVITKGSDTGIRLSAAVSQNHPSRVMPEQKLQLCSLLELSDGNIFMKTSTSVINNTHQHRVIYPAWNQAETQFKSQSSDTSAVHETHSSTHANASSFNGWPCILGVPMQTHSTVFKLYGNHPKS